MIRVFRVAGEPRSDALRMLPPVLLGLALCVLLPVQKVCAGSLDQQITLAIAANTRLDDALFAVADEVQLDIQVADSPAVARPVHELRGNFRAAAALAMLLEGSGLALSAVCSHTIYIKLAAAKAVSPKTGDCEEATENNVKDVDPPASVHGPHRKRPDASKSAQSIEEVTVTGRRIRGVSVSSPTIVLDRNYIESCLCQTIADVVSTLPQNTGGYFNSGVVGTGGSQSTTPLSGASAMNLRGLGSGSTLTLVNGRRLPPDGSGGADLTQIPLAAVDRMEVVTAGASAAYGSDAVAGVVNIILRDQYKGVEVRGLLGGATNGGGLTQRYGTTGGYGWDGGKGFVTLDCERQNTIDVGQRSYIASAGSATTLLPRTRLCSIFLEAQQTLWSRLEASFLSGYTRRSNSQSLNVASSSQDVLVATTADVAQYFVGTSLAVRLPGEWKVGVTGDISSDAITGSERAATPAFPPMYEANILDNGLRTVEVTADGTLLKLRTDALKLAVGAGYREETFRFDNRPATEFTISRARNVKFAFVEGHIPLLLSREGPYGPNSVTLSLATRRERHSDVGSTSTPQFSLTYVPLRDLKILVTWARSFHAPSLLQEYNVPQLFLNSFPDFSTLSGESVGLLRFGGNSQLRPERARTTSLDLTLTPSAWEGASFELTYYDTLYGARIEYPTANTGDPLADPNIGPFIQRNPSAPFIAGLVGQSQYTDLTAGKHVPGDAAVIIDDRYQNISQQHASGVDFLSGYSRDTGIGHLGGSLNLAYLDLRQRVISTAPLLRLSGTLYNPPVYRGRLGFNWGMSTFSASVFLNEIGPSHDLGSSPQQRLSAWTTVDAQVGYISPWHGLWGTTNLTLGARNLFNRRPPRFEAQQGGAAMVNFDWTNTSAIGCFVTLQITQSW